MDDEAGWVEAWRAGDKSAGRKLVERHYAAIYRFFFNKVDGQACEDLAQETFEVVFRRREAYRGEGSFRAYAYGVARFVLVNHIRRRRRQQERFEPAEHSAIDPATAGASEIFAAREHERIVAAALRSLPLDDQIVIELKDWEGLSQDELAVLFEVPRSTMASRISRARAKLRKALDERLTDAAMRAELLDDGEGLDTCMRSIHAKIQDHLTPPREG
jgi:RNA polymerase sigma factor (sigma-70 family)